MRVKGDGRFKAALHAYLVYLRGTMIHLRIA